MMWSQTTSNILTKDTEGQTFLIQKVTDASWSAVESGAREPLSIVKVRRGEVHNRGQKLSLRVLLNVTYTGGPSQSWGENGTGSYSRAVQPHRRPFFDLQPGWSYARFGEWIWGVKTTRKMEREIPRDVGFTCVTHKLWVVMRTLVGKLNFRSLSHCSLK